MSNDKPIDLSRAALEASQELCASEEIVGKLNVSLSQFVGPDFEARPGRVVDETGRRTEDFAAVIYLASKDTKVPSEDIPANVAAAVVDACVELDIEYLQNAYARIRQAKRLTKAPVPPSETRTNITLGIILAARTTVPMEVIGEELDRLNQGAPGEEWANMVVVANTGTINYGVQFPGEGLSGDLLPPAEGALKNFTPAFYIVGAIQAVGQYAFNKMLTFLLPHLGLFSPGAKLPDYSEIRKGVPSIALTLTGYQYNLQGQLLPVPRQFYNDRYIPARPFLIEDRKGNLLSTIRFLPWQDGGTILLTGKLPLDGLLLFLGKDVLKRGGVVKRDDKQISHVLPITEKDFAELLRRIGKQSNMVVREEPGGFVVQKVLDEGTSTPFIARVMMGLVHLRDTAFQEPQKRRWFDDLFEPVASALMAARDASRNVIQVWEGHAEKVASGEIVERRGRNTHIAEYVDKDLSREVEAFLNSSVRAAKGGIQTLAREMGVDIGFLFKKPDTFERGLAALQALNPDLANYMRRTREWSEPLITVRNDLEHSSWALPKVSYTINDEKVMANEPKIINGPMSAFVKFSFDRLACLTEDVTAHCLQLQMPAQFTITEIALAQRVQGAPERFMPTLVNGGLPGWRIYFHDSSFEDT